MLISCVAGKGLGNIGPIEEIRIAIARICFRVTSYIDISCAGSVRLKDGSSAELDSDDVFSKQIVHHTSRVYQKP